MIGGEDEPVGAARPDLADDRARRRLGRADPGARPAGRHRAGRLPALRPERRRPLREDGPQRRRVRDDGRDRRGAVDHPPRRRGQAPGRRSTPRRRRCATREYYEYDIDVAEVAEVWRRGSVVGSWLVDLTAAALARLARPRGLRRPRVGLRRGALDGDGGDRGGRARADDPGGAQRPLRVPRARACSPTRSSRRCAASSAATTRSRRLMARAGPGRSRHRPLRRDGRPRGAQAAAGVLRARRRPG